MKRIAACLLCLWLVVVLTACQKGTPIEGDAEPSADSAETAADPLDSFSFSLTWNCYGVSSYDSRTGKLVKTTDATKPEDYVTTYRLTAEQKKQIYDWIIDLQVSEYPDLYDPHEGEASAPPMTLILSVHTDTVQKTIRAENIAVGYKTHDKKGQKFLDVCEAIETLLTGTEAWKALPAYEFLYE